MSPPHRSIASSKTSGSTTATGRRIYDRVRRGLCERFSGAIVSGLYERFFVIDTAEDTAVLGVHFKPGGAFPFFDLPVSELTDNHIDLETLWGRSVRELRERLRAATTPIRIGAGGRRAFFDQSHLLRDFMAFSGFSPAEFARYQEALERRDAHLTRNHLALGE